MVYHWCPSSTRFPVAKLTFHDPLDKMSAIQIQQMELSSAVGGSHAFDLGRSVKNIESLSHKTHQPFSLFNI